MHELTQATLWHGRLMVLAWVFLFPLGVILARFFKILPNQNWPHRVDNKLWWYGHLSLQYTGAIFVAIALWLIIYASHGSLEFRRWHPLLGWITLLLLFVQLTSGWVRGSKGGPTDFRPDGSIRGDHFDMTLRRRVFEKIHKANGYLALIVAVITVLTGLNAAGAPVWMYLSLTAWWLTLIGVFVVCQYAGLYIDSYQAIWGHSPLAAQSKQGQHHPWHSKAIKSEDARRSTF